MMRPMDFSSRYHNNDARYYDYSRQERPLEQALQHMHGVFETPDNSKLLHDALGMAVDAEFMRKDLAWRREYAAEKRHLRGVERMKVIMEP